jgi:hypothetical protein
LEKEEPTILMQVKVKMIQNKPILLGPLNDPNTLKTTNETAVRYSKELKNPKRSLNSRTASFLIIW